MIKDMSLFCKTSANYSQKSW